MSLLDCCPLSGWCAQAWRGRSPSVCRRALARLLCDAHEGAPQETTRAPFARLTKRAGKWRCSGKKLKQIQGLGRYKVLIQAGGYLSSNSSERGKLMTERLFPSAAALLLAAAITAAPVAPVYGQSKPEIGRASCRERVEVAGRG